MNSKKPKPTFGRFEFRTWFSFGFSCLFIIILSVEHLSLFHELQEELQFDFDRSLYNYGQDLLENIIFNSKGGAKLPIDVIFSEDKVFPFPHGNSLVKIYNEEASQEYFSYGLDQDAPTDLSIIKQMISANLENKYVNLNGKTNNQWRAYLTKTFHPSLGKTYFLIAVPRTFLTNQETKFKTIFISTLLVILLLSVFGIFIITKSILRPLESLNEEIHNIPPGHFDYRFKNPSGPAEIVELVNLLNALMGKINTVLASHKEFVSLSAHQLKTPLTVAKGHLEQALSAPSLESESNKSVIQVALNEIDLMSKITENLLMLVQVESGAQKVNLTKFSALDTLMSQLNHLEYLSKKSDIKFKIICKENGNANFSLDWVMFSDEQLLSIILNTLLENAIKYTNSPIINIYLNQDEHFHSISITNSTELNLNLQNFHQNYLKEKWSRGHFDISGQGLGLYIAAKIAKTLNIDFIVDLKDSSFTAALNIPRVN